MRKTPPNLFGVSKSKTTWIVGVLFIALLVLVGYFVWNKNRPARYAMAADKAYLKATQTIDPEQLRAWALQSISRYPITNKNLGSRGIPKSEIPNQILRLWPTEPYVFVEQQETNNEKNVGIIWDGDQPGYKWWLVIGSTNFLQFSNTEVSCNYFQKVVWAPGIYYNRYPK
jgi:hypothetical protein